ncbi:hypothetical protein OCU04_010050 [Sclerotinia nivalis]|uniref:Uncharacterized protein n=1 Tax=Sclerotinia nivalis TaxID=352851 RepID=A0A9X0ADW9_9HELO|nr:hypothetical protein OCU04_010050 [Sclerotinia nivalis]
MAVEALEPWYISGKNGVGLKRSNNPMFGYSKEFQTTTQHELGNRKSYSMVGNELLFPFLGERFYGAICKGILRLN